MVIDGSAEKLCCGSLPSTIILKEKIIWILRWGKRAVKEMNEQKKWKSKN